MRESVYQRGLKKRIEELLPGCVIIKNDPEQRQGLPDLLVLYLSNWAMLEVKASENAPERPNQGYYVDLFNSMSFAAFIFPENEEEVLYDLQRSLRSGRAARIS